VTGPFTDSEDAILRNHLHADFERGRLRIDLYLMALMFRFALFRPQTMADLKVKHFHALPGPDGTTIYSLDYPFETKERGGRFLDALVPNKPLLPEIGALIETYIKNHIQKHKDLDCAPDDLPLFISPMVRDMPIDPIRPFHLTGKQMGKRLLFYESYGVITPRTNDFINVTAKRFRNYGATLARRWGATQMEISELLGHAGMGSVAVYAAMDTSELEEIDRRMRESEEFLASGFMGRLTDKPVPDEEGIFSKTGMVLGGCKTQCGMTKPIACWTCPQFSASTVANLEGELALLESDRERIMIATSSEELASINDSSIDALKGIIILKNYKISNESPLEGSEQ
jgi:hypothetical protein